MEVVISGLILIGIVVMTEVKAHNGTSKMHRNIITTIEEIKLSFKK